MRRWRQAEAADFGLPTAATTRWRVSVLPSTPLPVPGIGRARWGLELIRCRGGGAATFELEACDAKGRLALTSTQQIMKQETRDEACYQPPENQHLSTSDARSARAGSLTHKPNAGYISAFRVAAIGK